MKDLRVRFGVILAMALLPLLLFSIWQVSYSYMQLREQNRERLISAAEQSANGLYSAIGNTQSILRTMGATRRERECTDVLQRVSEAFEDFQSLSVARPDGSYICSTDEVVARAQQFTRVNFLSADEPFLFLTRRQTSNEGSSTIIRIAHGDYNDAGRLIRIIIVDLRPGAILDDLENFGLFDDARITLISDTGDIIAGSSEQPRERRLQWMQTAKSEGYFSEVYRDSESTKRERVVVPMASQNAFISISVPYQSIWNWSFFSALATGFIPVLSWIFGFFAIWVATDRLILTHLRNMRASVLRFARGKTDERLGPQIDAAPASIADLGRTFDLMAERISTREAEIEDALDEKETLLREIHHRVKNNLQIIISLLNMQERKLEDAIAINAIRETRNRINAISLIHRGLYESDDIRYIYMENFLPQLIAELNTAMGIDERGIKVRHQIACQPLETDRAIPVALFVVEALTNSTKHGVPDGGEIHISVAEADNEVVVIVKDNGQAVDTVTDSENQPSGSGTGQKLMRGFARQLSGTLSQEQDETGYEVKLCFPVEVNGR